MFVAESTMDQAPLVCAFDTSTFSFVGLSWDLVAEQSVRSSTIAVVLNLRFFRASRDAFLFAFMAIRVLNPSWPLAQRICCLFGCQETSVSVASF